MQSDEDLGMAAAVAYEHHIMLNGGGYPQLHYNRECTMASRLVHVCDVDDALSTTRPYRDAWPSEKTMAVSRGDAPAPSSIRNSWAHSSGRSGRVRRECACSATSRPLRRS